MPAIPHDKPWEEFQHAWLSSRLSEQAGALGLNVRSVCVFMIVHNN